MIARDLREWIAQLEKEKELLRIKDEIKLEPDVGAIGKAICDLQGPGVLAENVYGYKTGVSIGLSAAYRRTAMAMGLPKTASYDEIKTKWRSTFDKYPFNLPTHLIYLFISLWIPYVLCIKLLFLLHQGK